MAETTPKENITPKKIDGDFDSIQRVTRFHGREHSRRDNFKIIMKPSKTGSEVHLTQCFKLLFKKMREVEDPKNTPLYESKQIPNTLCGLKMYFNQASHRPKGEALYVSIWMLIDLLYEELMDEARWWFI